MLASSTRRAAVFAHYDKDDIVDDYVYYYLTELQKVCDSVVFVSTARLGIDDLNKLSSLNIQATCKDNTGYDFMSYKVGIEELNLDTYDELIICNDSIYGPLQPLSQLFDKCDLMQADVWGITDSYQQSYHLQSYFIIFKQKALKSRAFTNFWSHVTVLNEKKDIIKCYEVGLSKTLRKDGLKLDALFKSEPRSFKGVVKILTENNFRAIKATLSRLTNRDLYRDIPRKIKDFGHKNPTHEHWRSSILDTKSPFVKIELLRDNPTKMEDINEIIPVIKSRFNYPTHLIARHLDRHKKN